MKTLLSFRKAFASNTPNSHNSSRFVRLFVIFIHFLEITYGSFHLQEFDHVRSLRDVSTPAEKTALVASLYNRRISDPSCLFPRFEYELTFISPTPCSEAVNASVNVFYDSLKLSVSRYLRGRGHPDLSGVRAIVHPSDIQNHRESLSLRSILLMLSVHGFETRPVIPASWKIRVRCFAVIALRRSYSLFQV